MDRNRNRINYAWLLSSCPAQFPPEKVDMDVIIPG